MKDCRPRDARKKHSRRRGPTVGFPNGLTHQTQLVGRGAATISYVPLVAKRFRAGRGFRDGAANDPAFCDFAQRQRGGDKY
jgi:hypothetical protein